MTKLQSVGLGLMLLVGCAEEQRLVAGNCSPTETCVTQQALTVDSVDILLVVDNSPSSLSKQADFKRELPRLISAITTGRAGSETFPPAKSVHVAVTTSDIGVGPRPFGGCTETGQDGVLIAPTEQNVTCDLDHPHYLAYEGGPAAVSVASSVACIPLPDEGSDFSTDPNAPTPVEGTTPVPLRCGFEQPLEAGLKALWPHDAAGLDFISGGAHGDTENDGFLRSNSLLVVLVVSDEDDCSARDSSVFDFMNEVARVDGPNMSCPRAGDKLYDVSRYVDKLKALRPGNDNLVFGIIAGVPAETTGAALRDQYDLSTSAGTAAYYDAVLAREDMQVVVDPATVSPEGGHSTNIKASCSYTAQGGELNAAYPPRRLIEVLKGFGTQSVLGSICDADFGETTGQLIRTIGQHLTAPTQH